MTQILPLSTIFLNSLHYMEKRNVWGKNTAVRHKELTADPVTMWTGAFGLV